MEWNVNNNYNLTNISFRITNIHFNAMTKHCNRKCIISPKTKGLPEKIQHGYYKKMYFLLFCLKILLQNSIKYTPGNPGLGWRGVVNGDTATAQTRVAMT